MFVVFLFFCLLNRFLELKQSAVDSVFFFLFFFYSCSRMQHGVPRAASPQDGRRDLINTQRKKVWFWLWRTFVFISVCCRILKKGGSGSDGVDHPHYCKGRRNKMTPTQLSVLCTNRWRPPFPGLFISVSSDIFCTTYRFHLKTNKQKKTVTWSSAETGAEQKWSF